MKRLAVYAAAAVLYATCSITAFADAEGTVIPGSAKVRSSADTSSEAVASVKSNDKLTITGKTTGTDGKVWYQIVDGNTKGYIRSDLVKVNGTVEGGAGSEATVTQTNADVQPSSFASGTVNTNSVNVRKGPASTDAKAGSAKEGTVVSILGETTGADGKTWYQVSFNSNGNDVTGFVREDFVNAVAAEEGSEEGEEPAAEGEAEGTDAEAAQPENTSNGYTEVSNVVSSRVLPEDADLSKMEIDESKLEEWESGNYYLLYTTDTKGGKYWYLYDLSNKQCTKINNLAGGEETSAASGEGLGSTGKIIIAVLAVFVIALIVAVTILLLKLRNAQWDDYDEEDDEYYGEDDEEEVGAYEEGRVNSRRWKPRNFLRSGEEDYEDEEEAYEEEEEPVRPVRRREAPAPQRAQAPVQGGGQRPARAAASAQGAAASRRAAAPAQGAAASRRAAAPAGQGEHRASGQAQGRAQRPAGARQPQGEAAQGAPRRAEDGGQRPARQTAPAQGARPVKQGGGQRTAGNNGQRPVREQAPEAARRQPAGPERGPADMQQRTGERPIRTAEPAHRAEQSRPAQPLPKPPQAYYEEDDDDEFEFEFLNMDGKDDL